MTFKEKIFKKKGKEYEEKIKNISRSNEDRVVAKHQEEMFKKIDKVGNDFKNAIDEEVRKICTEVLIEKGLIKKDEL